MKDFYSDVLFSLDLIKMPLRLFRLHWVPTELFNESRRFKFFTEHKTKQIFQTY